MTTGRMFGLTRQQQTARLNGEDAITLTPGQIATLRRTGLIARARDWYYAPCGSLALSPGDPGLPWGEGRRRRIDLQPVTRVRGKAA